MFGPAELQLRLLAKRIFCHASRVVSHPSSNHLPGAEQARWFAEEVQPHEPALRAWLRRQFPGLGDVDDVVQESYLNLLQQRPVGRIAFAKSYLFAVARHAVLKGFRRRRLYSDVPVNDLPEWQLLDGGVGVNEAVNVRQQDDLMAAAIAQLPGRCREIVKLRVVHGLSYAAIAAQLALSESTVRVQTARGVKKCARFLREAGAHHEP